MANFIWSVVNAFIGEYSFRDDNDNQIGTLKFPDINKIIAQASSGPFNWTFGRSGFPGAHIEIRTTDNPPQNVAALDFNIFGDSTFNVSGSLYRWNRVWALSPDWLFRNDMGKELIIFSPSKSQANFFVKVKTQSDADSLSERDRVLMELLGFYVLIVLKEFS